MLLICARCARTYGYLHLSFDMVFFFFLHELVPCIGWFAVFEMLLQTLRPCDNFINA